MELNLITVFSKSFFSCFKKLINLFLFFELKLNLEIDLVKTLELANAALNEIHKCISSGGKIFIALLKWGVLIAGSILGVHMINLATDGENWFGDPKGVAPMEVPDTEDESGNVDGEVNV